MSGQYCSKCMNTTTFFRQPVVITTHIRLLFASRTHSETAYANFCTACDIEVVPRLLFKDHIQREVPGNLHVVLEESGQTPIAVIQAVMKLQRSSLKDAKSAVERCPTPLFVNVSLEMALHAQAELEKVGAIVSIFEE